MKFHFSGICGAGMGNVATLLRQMGHDVKGCDEHFFPPMSEQLAESSIELFQGLDGKSITKSYEPDVQVIANILSKTHPEVLAGEEGNWKKMSFPQVLGEYVLKDRKRLVVAGTHGKTTTSSVLAKILEPVGAGAFIGGIMQDGTPGSRLGEVDAPFVLEGDEYDTAWFDKGSKFLHYKPNVLILTHLEWDHVDIFPTFEKMIDQFRALLDTMPEDAAIFYCGDHSHLRELLKDYKGFKRSYGLEQDNDIVLSSAQMENGLFHLKVSRTGEPDIEIKTPLMGNIYHLNVLGATLAALHIGMKMEQINEQLKAFLGAKRRMEALCEKPFRLYSDFAHHPTAIAESVQILKEAFPKKKIWAIFDPRNATSRRRIFEERFAQSLSPADQVIIGPPYPDTRLAEEERFDAERLAQAIGEHAVGCKEESDLRDFLSKGIPDDAVLLVMSCGSFFGIIQELASGAVQKKN